MATTCKHRTQYVLRQGGEVVQTCFSDIDAAILQRMCETTPGSVLEKYEWVLKRTIIAHNQPTDGRGTYATCAASGCKADVEALSLYCAEHRPDYGTCSVCRREQGHKRHEHPCE